MLRIDQEKFGAPARPWSRPCKRKGSTVPPAMDTRCTSSRSFATGRSALTCRASRTGWTTTKVQCPNSDLLCREQAMWLEQGFFLGPRADVEDIARAFEKIHDNAAPLADWARSQQA